MKIRNLFSGLVIAFLITAVLPSAQAQLVWNPTAPIPPDSSVITGKLENGMVYYIRVNKTPEKQVHFRLVVNAGAILEEEDQKGLAHFTEHMAFNGTKNFPKNELVDILQKMGVRFGADLNAGTRQDYTTYELPFRMESKKMLHTAFQVMEDWAHNVSFTDEQIDGERGVILSEWRQGRNARRRAFDYHMTTMYQGSRYAERNVIGDTVTLAHFPYEAIRRFYSDWYRPDLMAFIAVGDFDKDEIEKLTQTYMGRVPMPPNPKVRKMYNVPDNPGVLVSVYTDKELSNDALTIYFKMPKLRPGTYGASREETRQQLYDIMFNERLQDISRLPDPPFLSANGRLRDFAGDKSAYYLSVQSRTGEYRKGLIAILNEAHRVRQYGFTQEELNRAKQQILSSVENDHLSRNTMETRRFVSAYTRNYIDKEPIPSTWTALLMTKADFDAISLGQINDLAKVYIGKSNIVVTLSLPEQEGRSLPAASDITGLLENAWTITQEPYLDLGSQKPLFTKELKPGKILSEKRNEALDLTEMQLENGVRVLLKKTSFQEDKVYLHAFAPGGLSLAPTKDLVSAAFSAIMVGESGTGGFNQSELRKNLAGHLVSVRPSVNDMSQSINGVSSPNETETLFQLVYLYFTEPGFDKDAISSTIKRMRSRLENRTHNAEVAFGDTIQNVLSSYNPRALPMTAERLADFDAEKSFEFYRMLFNDASNYSFVLLGNFDTAKARACIQTYLANLPAKNQPMSWADQGLRYPMKKEERHLVRGKEDRSHVKLIITGPFDTLSQNRYLLTALGDLLKIRFTEVIREEKSGVYSPRVTASYDIIPVPMYQISFDFVCEPKRVQELIDASLTIIDDLKRTADPVTTDKIKKAQLIQYEKGLEDNEFWLNSLMNALQLNEDPSTITEYPARVEALTAEDIRMAAEKYLNKDALMKFVLDPEQK